MTYLYLIPFREIFCSIKYSRELSRTTTRSQGASFRSDRESVSRIGIDGAENVNGTRVSSKRLYSMVGPDWMYGVTGTVCALIAGAQMPLFALGVTQALVSYYMDWDTTQREVKKIAFLFCGGAFVTVIVHAIAHLCFGIMGERLTLRVRERMFSGKNYASITCITIISFIINYKKERHSKALLASVKAHVALNNCASCFKDNTLLCQNSFLLWYRVTISERVTILREDAMYKESILGIPRVPCVVSMRYAAPNENQTRVRCEPCPLII